MNVPWIIDSKTDDDLLSLLDGCEGTVVVPSDGWEDGADDDDDVQNNRRRATT
jgi:hypothetical protein